MQKLSAILLMVTIAFIACNVDSNKPSAYHDNSNRADSLSGGVQLIPITTSKGVFNVWTKRVGNNPKIKVLLLHGGPGSTHEYFECFENFLPKEEIEFKSVAYAKRVTGVNEYQIKESLNPVKKKRFEYQNRQIAFRIKK